MITTNPELWTFARLKPGDRVAIVVNIPDLIEANDWWGWRHYAADLAPGKQGMIADVRWGLFMVTLDSLPEHRFAMRSGWLAEIERRMP